MYNRLCKTHRSISKVLQYGLDGMSSILGAKEEVEEKLGISGKSQPRTAATTMFRPVHFMAYMGVA